MWNVFVRSGAAGGVTREATINLTIQTEADTVEEVRAKVEALPDLIEALDEWAFTFRADEVPEYVTNALAKVGMRAHPRRVTP